MMSSKALGLSASLRAATFTPKILRNQAVLRNIVQRRTVQTTSYPASKATEILNQQRLRRPSSPHFTIYQPQLTWIPSIFNRITGVGLSVLLYGFSLAYLVAPGTFDSVHVVEFVAGLPDAVKLAGKTILAAPFAFHSLNGIRHLAWDMGKFMTVKGCYNTIYAVLGGTVASTLALVFYM
ncbi:hypothetical protein H0H81_003843 [Sphagnurus paluster]|uniref:Succinate dehydrogenase cytochrome b560 subunit, mitochondrial n=1 Tax=Sphagnurus paluster TaxID=117069 RepID=A0A9P7KMM8_9AGAR|nr:hypothetical protein H0H81_003843 [Sphagnurus paluster]